MFSQNGSEDFDVAEAKRQENLLDVLRQMGNHGSAYFKRYPKEYEVFTPVCETNQLEACSQQEIINAYDNAVLYTDHFLASVIEFMKPYDDEFSTAMFYMADHAESLGGRAFFPRQLFQQRAGPAGD